jgi:hypothetical protein
LGITNADRVADITSTVDITNGDRAALRIRARETTTASTRGARGAAKTADARGQATAGFVEAATVALIGAAVQVAVVVESVPGTNQRRISTQALIVVAAGVTWATATVMGCYVRRAAPECCQERRATDADKTPEHAPSGTRSRHGAGPIVEPPIIHHDPLSVPPKPVKTAHVSERLNRSPIQPN